MDFLDFKEAFLLYFNRNKVISEDLQKKLLKLKEGINKGRVDFILPPNHQINITGYWLAGLIDGEGSFVLSIQKEPKNKTGWTIKSRLSLSMKKI